MRQLESNNKANVGNISAISRKTNNNIKNKDSYIGTGKKNRVNRFNNKTNNKQSNIGTGANIENNINNNNTNIYNSNYKKNV